MSRPQNLSQLKKLAEERGIGNYESMNRAELENALKTTAKKEGNGKASKKRSASDDIEAKRVTKQVKVEAKKVEPIAINDTDPILLDPIKKTRSIMLQRPTGEYVAYNVESLVDYITTSGDFSDPITRVPFSESDLQTIDTKAKSLKLKRRSVLDFQRDNESLASIKFRRDALLGLERCAGEIIAEILDAVETMERNSAKVFIMEKIPEFSNYFVELLNADYEYGYQCMENWKEFLRGPPRKRTEDKHNLITPLLMLLETIYQTS